LVFAEEEGIEEEIGEKRVQGKGIRSNKVNIREDGKN
jgi:hypothetical protein